MSFFPKFDANFSSIEIDLKPNKYFFNDFDLFLLVQQNKTLRPKVENKNEEDIKNLFYFYLRINFCFFLSKKGL